MNPDKFTAFLVNIPPTTRDKKKVDRVLKKSCPFFFIERVNYEHLARLLGHTVICFLIAIRIKKSRYLF